MENVFILWVNVHNFLEILNIKANLIMYKKSEYLIPSALHPVFSALFFLFSYTPQYRYLNELQKTYGEAYGERQPEGKKHCRLQIFGFPCNQFRYQAKYTNFTYFFNSIQIYCSGEQAGVFEGREGFCRLGHKFLTVLRNKITCEYNNALPSKITISFKYK